MGKSVGFTLACLMFTAAPLGDAKTRMTNEEEDINKFGILRVNFSSITRVVNTSRKRTCAMRVRV